MTRQKASPSFIKFTVLLSGLLLMGLTQGCVDLKAVQDFANLSAESAKYTSLVENYSNFPNRQKRYQPTNPINPISIHEKLLDDMAEERMGQKKELLLQHKTIEEYMEALGGLAADDIVDKSKEISNLTTAVEALGPGVNAEIEASDKIARILIKAISDGWRKRQLQKLIESSNAPLQIILKNLKYIVSDLFVADDTAEHEAIVKYYRTIIAEVPSDSAGNAALMEWQDLRLAKLTDHTKILQTYAALLDEISEGHQNLYNERKGLSTPQLVKQIKHSAKELRDLLDAIKKI